MIYARWMGVRRKRWLTSGLRATLGVLNTGLLLSRAADMDTALQQLATVASAALPISAWKHCSPARPNKSQISQPECLDQHAPLANA